jgi:hypothetical protein
MLAYGANVCPSHTFSPRVAKIDKMVVSCAENKARVGEGERTSDTKFGRILCHVDVGMNARTLERIFTHIGPKASFE